jgi:serine/threonine-protein kinase
MRDLEAGDKLDHYTLIELISRTGMAATFRALDTDTGQTVAVKVPHFEYESDLVFYQRITREEGLGLRLDHPSLVKTLRPRDKSRPYLVTELVEGQSLRSLLQHEAPLPPARAIAIVRRLCDVLAYLHEQGVAHRDVKPENVLIRPDDGIVLIDLGLSHDRAARRITWGRMAGFGTPDYMPPERVAGKRGDARSDVYAVGLVLHEMLTGRLPHTPFIGLSEVEPGLEAILTRALQPRPYDRYDDARAMIADLADPSAAARRVAAGAAAPIAPSVRRRAMFSITVAAVIAGLGFLVALSR